MNQVPSFVFSWTWVMQVWLHQFGHTIPSFFCLFVCYYDRPKDCVTGKSLDFRCIQVDVDGSHPVARSPLCYSCTTLIVFFFMLFFNTCQSCDVYMMPFVYFVVFKWTYLLLIVCTFLVSYVKRLNIPSGVVGACRLDLAYEHFKVCWLPAIISCLVPIRWNRL